MILTAAFFNLNYAPEYSGALAGVDAGITQIEGKATSVRVSVYEATPVLRFVKSALSTEAGHYLLTDLNPERRYLIIARDLKQGYQPDLYDHLKPAPMSQQEVKQRVDAWAK